MREQQKYLDENIQASLDEAINIMEQSLNAVRMKMYGDFGDHSAVSTTALKVGLGDLKIDYCFVHSIFRFWFFVTFGNEVTKIRKYYVIFVYILQGKMGKTEKNRKENHATKVTKILKNKRREYGVNLFL